MSYDYEKYEKDCTKIREENETYLALFEKDLIASGLSAKTVGRHVSNASFYINDFLLYDDANPMCEGTKCVHSFFGDFFIRKCMWSTPASIKSTAASLKKFYKCMLQHGYIDKESYDYLCFDIKENMEDWQEECANNNNTDETKPFYMF